MEYLSRIADGILQDNLEASGAVLVKTQDRSATPAG